MAYSKLSIINRNLAITGQAVVAAEDNGSNEWNVCSAAYDDAVAYLINSHDWKFATSIETLARTGDSPDRSFEDAYARPNDCLHIIWVRIYDTNSEGYVETDYRVIGNEICLTDGSATVVEAKIVLAPDANEFPPVFVSALNSFVQAGIYRGLKRDEAEAERREARAEQLLETARTRTDQQEPKRAMFVSSLSRARTLRRG